VEGVPAMIEMTLATAQRAAQAALARAEHLGVAMTVAVVDEAGRTVLILRADGASFLSAETTRAKAITAANFRRSTREIAESAPANAMFWNSASAVTNGQLLASPGGVPIRKEGRVIGAIGCGGGQALQDDECATAGADAVAAPT
jgi:glc operon protein GlcG